MDIQSLNKHEITVLIKMTRGQMLVVDFVDNVHLHDLQRKLQNILSDRKAGSGVMDMRTSGYSRNIGDFNFKLILNNAMRVPAIKIIREATGFGLKEAKDLSDLGYQEFVPRGEVTILNSTEDLYNKFKAIYDNPGTGSVNYDQRIQDAFQVVALSPVTPPVGPA